LLILAFEFTNEFTMQNIPIICKFVQIPCNFVQYLYLAEK